MDEAVIQKREVPQADREAIQRIKSGIRPLGRELRQRYTILKYQDAIGLIVSLGSFSGMLLMAWGYLAGVVPAWLAFVANALFASLIHEIEHDLIHEQYFAKQRWVQHLLYALGWLARPSTINPWIRKRIHLLHHKISGTSGDLEERGITNGERWGLMRFIATFDGLAAVLIRTWRHRRNIKRAQFSFFGGLISYFPLGLIHWAMWWSFIALTVSGWLGAPLAFSAEYIELLNLAMVVWIGPNLLRSFCLHFVSSNMHYFGDIEKGNFLKQTQVWTAWWTWPLQLFCFNFAGTHAIHHFIVGEPFYIRQMTARKAQQVMRGNGVRFDDYSGLKRANRWAKV